MDTPPRNQFALHMVKGKKIRILIGDDRPVFRAGLRKLLSREPGFKVVGEAENARQVLKRVRELQSEVLLLGALLATPNEDGFDVLGELQRKHKNTRVIILASSEKEEDFLRSAQRAAAIISKNSPFSLLAQCIRRTDAGEAWVDPPLMPAAARSPSAGLEAQGGRGMDTTPLSAREKQVVELISQGFRNKEIAERMFISEQTVKNHLHNIFDKLGVSDRLELALYAIHKNLQAPQQRAMLA